MGKFLVFVACALCLLPLGAGAAAQTPELTLNAKAMTTWLIEDQGISIALTSDGARDFHLLAGQSPDKPVMLYVEGRATSEAEMRETDSGSVLFIPFSDETKAQMLKLFQDETVCDDAGEICWLPRMALRPR